MIKQGYREVKIGNFLFPVSEQNTDEFQKEVEQIMVIMKLSEMDVKVEQGRTMVDAQGRKVIDSFSIEGKGSSAGWRITFANDVNRLSVDVIGQMSFDEITELRIELENQHGSCVKKRMGGVLVKDNERAMIDLLSKIKYKV
jgi:hypothetical protein